MAGLVLTALLVGYMFCKQYKKSRQTDTLTENKSEYQLSVLKIRLMKYEKRAFEKMCDRFELVDALYYPLNEPQEIWNDVHYTLVVTREKTGIRYYIKTAKNHFKFSGYIELISNKKEFQLPLSQRDGNQSQGLLHCFNQQVKRIRKQMEEPLSLPHIKTEIDVFSPCISLQYQELKIILSQLKTDSKWLTDSEQHTVLTVLTRKLSLIEKNASVIFASHGDNKDVVLENNLAELKKQLQKIRVNVQKRKVNQLEQQLRILREG